MVSDGEHAEPKPIELANLPSSEELWQGLQKKFERDVLPALAEEEERQERSRESSRDIRVR